MTGNPAQLLVIVPIQKELCNAATLNAVDSIKNNFKTLLESNDSFSRIKAVHNLLHSSIEDTSYSQQWTSIKEQLSLVVCAPDATIKVDLSTGDRQLITLMCADFCKTISGSPAEWYDTLLAINADNFKSIIESDINSRTSILNTIKTEGGIGQAYQCVKNGSQQIINGIKNLHRGCTPKTFLKKVQANEVNKKIGRLIQLAENNKSNEAILYLKTNECLLPYNRMVSGLPKNKTEPLVIDNTIHTHELVAIDEQPSLPTQVSAHQTPQSVEKKFVKNELSINGLPKTEESVTALPQWDYAYNAPVIASLINLSKHQKKYNYHLDSSIRKEITNSIEKNFNACREQLDRYEQKTALVLPQNQRQADLITNRRCEAFNFIKEHGSIVYEQNYELSLESKWLLDQKKENQRVLEYCIGNAVQQVLHTEVVELFNKVSEVAFKKTASDYDKTLNGKIADYLLYTAKANLEGHASHAMSLSDLCWSLFEYGQTASQYVGHSLKHGFNEVSCTAQNVAQKLYVVAENIVFSDANRVVNPFGSSIAHSLKKTMEILSDCQQKISNNNLNIQDKSLVVGNCLYNLLTEVPKTFATELRTNMELGADCILAAFEGVSELGNEIAVNPEAFVINTTKGLIHPFVYAADILLDLADAASQNDLEKCTAKLNGLYTRVTTDGINLAKTLIVLTELPTREKAKLVGRVFAEGFLFHKGLGFINDATSPAIQVAIARAESILYELEEVKAVAQTAEGFAVETKIPAQFMEAEKKITDVGKLIINNKHLDEYINAVLKDLNLLSGYFQKFHMESIIDVEKITKTAKLFEKVDGFCHKDGPLYKILKTGTKVLEVNDINTARGAIYELEKALSIESNGDKVIYFGKKLMGDKTCEFDIETLSKLIECKDRCWQNINAKKMQTMKSRFIEQKKNASAYGKIFEVHSKQSIPEHWQKWFSDNSISFIQG